MDLNEDIELQSPHEAFKNFIKISESEGWVCHRTITLPDGRSFNMYEKESDMKFPILKCVGTIKTTPTKLTDFFLNADLETRKKITPNLSLYKIIKEFEPGIHLLHYVYKAPFPVKSRDFCLKRFVHSRNSDILICGVSIVDDDLPPVKKYIRGEVLMSGYLFESISKEETQITSIIYIDPKGWIPNFVVKASKTGELSELTNIAKIVES